MPERFRVVCIPYKALYKCWDFFNSPLLIVFMRYGTRNHRLKSASVMWPLFLGVDGCLRVVQGLACFYKVQSKSRRQAGMTDRTFIDECIRSINDYRRIHQVSPLTHNAVISTTSQRWADHMARTGSLGHNPNASYSGQQLGENCAFKWFSDRRDITGM